MKSTIKNIGLVFLILFINTNIIFSQETEVQDVLNAYGTFEILPARNLDDSNERLNIIDSELTIPNSMFIDTSILNREEANLILTEEEKQFFLNMQSSPESELSSEEITGSPENFLIPSTIMPSPNSTSLIPKLNDGVNLYTGKVELEYPIYTFKSGDIEIPIGLQYSSNGVKVNEISSWVGLNWSLNAGGVITRVMHSIPDEYNGGFLTPYTNDKTIKAKGFLKVPNYSTESYFCSRPSEDDRKRLVEYSNKSGDFYSLGGDPEIWDTEQDEFYFNFGNYSGKFVFNNNGEIDIIPKQNLIIKKIITSKGNIDDVTPHITGFTVITPDGTEYVFGNLNVQSKEDLTSVEMTEYSTIITKCRFGYVRSDKVTQHEYLGDIWRYSDNSWLMIEGDKPSVKQSRTSGYLHFTSSWYLKQIKSQSGNIVTLNYDKSSNDLKYISSCTNNISQKNLGRITDGEYYYRWSFYEEKGTSVGVRGNKTQYRHSPQDIQFSVNYNYVTNLTLAGISDLNGNKIEFLSEPRPDIVNGRRLSQINIRSNTELIKSYQLKYDEVMSNIELYLVGMFYDPYCKPHFEDLLATESGVSLLDLETADHFRLYLKEIIEKDSNEGNPISTNFKYNNKILPRRFSYRQDKWGYYNLNEAGNYLKSCTYVDLVNSRRNINIYYSFDTGKLGAPDISPDENKSKAGILESVIYPTGSVKKFYYSQNRNQDNNLSGGVRLSETETYNSESLINSTQYTYSDGYSVNNPSWLYYNLIDIISNTKLVISSSTSIGRFYETHGSSIGYGLVKKVYDNGSFEEHHFTTPNSIKNLGPIYYDTDKNIIPSSRQWTPMTDLDYKRGLITDIYFKTHDEKTVKHINYQYSDNYGPIISTSSSMTPLKFSYNGIPKFYAAFHKNYSQYLELEKKTIKEYSSDFNSYNEKVINYSYNDYNQIKKITTTNSKGEILSSYFKYPLDYNAIYEDICQSDLDACIEKCWDPGDGLALENCIDRCNELYDVCNQGTEVKTTSNAILLMQNNNIINPIIEEYHTLTNNEGEFVVGGKLTKYKEFDVGNIKPSKTYKRAVKNPININDIVVSSIVNNGADVAENFVYDSDNFIEENSFEWDQSNIIQFNKKYDNPIAYQWGYNNQYPIVEAKNAKYNDIFYTSFDDEPEIFTWHPYEIDYTKSKSGKASLKSVNSGTSAYYYFLPFIDIDNSEATTYKYSGWVYNSSGAAHVYFFYKQDNSEDPYSTGWHAEYQSTAEINKWVYLQGEVTVPSTMKCIFMRVDNRNGGTTWFDDIKFWIADAQMKTFTYEPLVGMTSSTDAANRTNTYEYDDFGRLKLVKDHNEDIVNKHVYHFRGAPHEEYETDLSLGSIVCPSIKNYDDLHNSINVSLTVSNLSNNYTKACKLYYYISENSTFNESLTRIGEVDINAINGLSNENLSFQVQLPNNLTENKTYYMFFKADGDYQNYDSNDSNNLISKNIFIKDVNNPGGPGDIQ